MTAMVQHVKTADEFRALLETSSEKKLVVVDFSASWCPPCRRVAPIFEELAKSNPDVTFAKVDVDESPGVRASCGVDSMPTFQFFKGGSDPAAVVRGAEEEKVAALVEELRVEGVTRSKESHLLGFCDACLSGDADAVRRHLGEHPDLATLPSPREWHDHHTMRRGWQPVESALNPGVMNSERTVFLMANHPSYGLHLAAGNGHADVVKVLLEEAGADLEATDGDGDAALAWATWTGRRDLMDRLLAAGADSSFVNAVSREQFEATQGDGGSFQYLKAKRSARTQR